MTDSPPARTLPSGTVTFLFTDIEGSTALLQRLGDEYAILLADHHRLLRHAFGERGGVEVDAAGDGLYFAFPSARFALLAGIAGQQAVAAHEWSAGAAVAVRMGLHTGEAISAEDGYVGIDVHRAARICAAGHGGQLLISQTTRDLVADELPPQITLRDLGEHRLRDLAGQQRLFQAVVPDLPSEFPSLRSVESHPNNLPRQLTSFVGRERQLAEAKRLLASSPLLTLTGPGGVGKTRIALQLAEELLGELKDGAWLVDLGVLTDPDFLAPAVASALGLAEQPGRPLLATIRDHLHGRELLLVLDNCEHVVAASAALADSLLRSSPLLRIVATSREGLGIAGEALFPVPSLALPESDRILPLDQLSGFEAIRLFADRASAVLPSFELSASSASAVAQICRRLDGIPLALELAAARVRALSVEQIAARLDDRFRLLAGGSRAAVPRHQALRAAIDWSFDLLSEEERATWRRLSVFAGGFTLEAAEAICAGESVQEFEVLDLLSRLVEKSLVVSEAMPGEARFRLLETVRQYAREKLLGSGEAADAMRRHRNWFLAVMTRIEPQFFGGARSGSGIEELDREHDNLRAALEWSADEPGEAAAGLQLAAGLWRFWEIRGHVVEGRAWLERLLAASSGESLAARSSALTGAGVLAHLQGDYDAAFAFHEESLILHRQVGNPQSIAYAANNLANAAVEQGDYARARALYKESLELARAGGDIRGSAIALINLADVVARQGDLETARSLFEESIATFREHEDNWGMAFALDSFGVVARRHGDHPSARLLHGEAMEISQALGDERGVARALAHLAEVASLEGDTAEAAKLYRESLAIRQRLGDLPGIATGLEKLAAVLSAQAPDTAGRLLGRAEALRQSIRAPTPAEARAEYERCFGQLAAVLGAERLEAARSEGRKQGTEELLATLPR
ncbi:MAG: tetratricopeptide repeat protein [Chloroflexota bacterium]|nr:tetratricopeptide repeat protein [Chloroflexota bacterium]